MNMNQMLEKLDRLDADISELRAELLRLEGPSTIYRKPEMQVAWNRLQRARAEYAHTAQILDAATA